MRLMHLGTTAVAALICTGSAMAELTEAVSNPTFTKDVAPILFENCTSCHQPGQSAPMSLLSYREVRPWAKSIVKNVQERTMPPWHASPEYGEFSNDRSLSQAEIDTITNWVNKGTKRGDVADLPPMPKLKSTDWTLGKPDQVVTYKEVELPGGGPDQFFDLYADPQLSEDRWLTAVEMKPSNPLVAHHVILYQMIPGKGMSPNGWIGAWAAGTDPMEFNEGTGRMLKKGARIVADMHYHPAETPQKDTLSVGLHFADNADSINKEVINLWIAQQGIDIAPGEKNYVKKSSYTFKQDSHILAFLPHMHYRGRQFTYKATYPDGSKETLLHVPDYNFAWQTQYTLEEPLSVPAGTTIDCTAIYDNSTDNPYNPDPTARVTDGDESFDEMMIGFVDYIVDDGVRPVDAKTVLSEIADGILSTEQGTAYDITVGGQFPSVLHLPQGAENAVWHVAIMGDVREVALNGIEWTGDDFQVESEIPGFGVFTLEGAVDSEKKTVKGKIDTGENFGLPIFGKVIE